MLKETELVAQIQPSSFKSLDTWAFPGNSGPPIPKLDPFKRNFLEKTMACIMRQGSFIYSEQDRTVQQQHESRLLYIQHESF